MDDLACPRCKTTKYRNPALKLLVNTCGHALCDNCVELLFVKGSGACPECGIPLRRSGFRLQLFEDPAVEKEVDIRRRVLKDFTKQQSDFPTLRQYNDYLEQVETIIFNLANNIDIIETNKLIEQYKKENKDQIAKSRSHKPNEILELENILLEEAKRSEIRRIESITSEKEEKMRKMKNREALIDDLMFLESDAKSIVEQHKATTNVQESSAETKAANAAIAASMSRQQQPPPPTTFTSGIGFGIGTGITTGFLPVPKIEEVPLFVYKPLVVDIGGPNPPSKEDLLDARGATYLNHVRAATEAELAAGYHHLLACRRALQDAFMDIAMQPKLLVAQKLSQQEEQEMMDTS